MKVVVVHILAKSFRHCPVALIGVHDSRENKMLRAISDVAYARGDYETEMEQDALQSEAEKKI